MPPDFILSTDNFIDGTLNNIQRDGDGNIVSAEVVDLRLNWELEAEIGGVTAKMYTQDGMSFGGTLSNSPAFAGSVLISNDVSGGLFLSR